MMDEKLEEEELSVVAATGRRAAASDLRLDLDFGIASVRLDLSEAGTAGLFLVPRVRVLRVSDTPCFPWLLMSSCFILPLLLVPDGVASEIATPGPWALVSRRTPSAGVVLDVCGASAAAAESDVWVELRGWRVRLFVRAGLQDSRDGGGATVVLLLDRESDLGLTGSTGVGQAVLTLLLLLLCGCEEREDDGCGAGTADACSSCCCCDVGEGLLAPVFTGITSWALFLRDSGEGEETEALVLLPSPLLRPLLLLSVVSAPLLLLWRWLSSW